MIPDFKSASSAVRDKVMIKTAVATPTELNNSMSLFLLA
jgi:hypothetical protein